MFCLLAWYKVAIFIRVILFLSMKREKRCWIYVDFTCYQFPFFFFLPYSRWNRGFVPLNLCYLLLASINVDRDIWECFCFFSCVLLKWFLNLFEFSCGVISSSSQQSEIELTKWSVHRILWGCWSLISPSIIKLYLRSSISLGKTWGLWCFMQ